MNYQLTHDHNITELEATTIKLKYIYQLSNKPCNKDYLCKHCQSIEFIDHMFKIKHVYLKLLLNIIIS